ncbi:MAG TPA: hypothetical protein DCQ04_05580 [Actinobacteria bacterium]|nr:hypothetical protein [Actinomycetota bacterium]
MADNQERDPHPEDGPWLPVTEPPNAYETVTVLLPDGSTEPGTWTGKLWWRNRELHPVGWRRLPRLHSNH